jgi:hypothetical protein
MRFDTEHELRELSLEPHRARLAPVLDAVRAHGRCRRLRAVLTVVAVVASFPVLALALWPALRVAAWSGLLILVDAAALFAFTWAVLREQVTRRTLRRLVNEASQPEPPG